MRLRALSWMMAALLAAVTAPAGAAMILKMNLAQLTDRADAIFRGEVLSAEPGKIAIGGGTLPTVTYRLRIDEAFKGTFEAKENASPEVEITMLGTFKTTARSGGQTRLSSSLPEVPELRVGESYVLFTTAPGASGLRAPVGLGQGSFRIYAGENKSELAVNELNNLGLFDGAGSAQRGAPGIEGPVTYTRLATAILTQLGK
ncbi:MAG TPA: hypothetical protein VGD45_12040 [Steroidobacter sp.]|uniref:hypothetical protein n=1 Tax=Steroidobacter sp. TaxID=1978227 RepID=UPI002EDB7555